MLRQLFPENPIELAAPVAESLVWRDEATQAETVRALSQLDDSADIMGFTGRKYFVRSARSLVLPLEPEESEWVECGDYYDFMFEGEFKTFSHVQIGTIIGGSAVKALCAMFDNVMVVPDFEWIPPDRLLHVPILAVETIDPQAA